jgi:hypothetical protein
MKLFLVGKLKGRVNFESAEAMCSLKNLILNFFVFFNAPPM